MKPESLNAIYEAYDIEQACIGEMKAHIDETQFAKAVECSAMPPVSVPAAVATPALSASIWPT